MNNFNDRKNAFLEEYKLSEEQKFKIRNLTNKKLAAFFGQLVGLNEERQQQFMHTLIEKDIIKTGQSLVAQEISHVLTQHGKEHTLHSIEEKIISLTEETTHEVRDR